MNMTVEQIKQEIKSGEIKAITLDTSIFDQKQNGLEDGLLRQIEQFNDAITTVVFSDVVLREVESHIKKAASESQAAMKAALKLVGKSWQIPKETRTETFDTYFGASSPEAIAQKRVNDFVEKTGAEIVKAGETVDVHELVDRYFTPQPPFAERKEKKNEFPDALALLSLESWADDYGQKVLVVVKDGDWVAYCETSERLIAINDLQEALTLFQPQNAIHVCQRLVEMIREGDSLGFIDAIEQEIYSDLESKYTFNPIGDSHMSFESGWLEISSEFQGIHGFDDKGFQMDAVKFTDDQLVVSLKVNVVAELDCSFDFFAYDSIDKDYVRLGSGSESTTMDLVVEVLVTLAGSMPDFDEIEDVEIIGKYLEADFGYIEPDWAQYDNPEHEKY